MDIFGVYAADGQNAFVGRLKLELIPIHPVIQILRTCAIWEQKTAIRWWFALSWVASFTGVGYCSEQLFKTFDSGFTFPPVAVMLTIAIERSSRSTPS
jgi:hypothetical protein